MLQRGDQLVDILWRRMGRDKAARALEDAGRDLGLPEGASAIPVCAAYVLLKQNVQADEVSRLLSWQEFEKLAGALLHVSGYEVRENVVLVRPRAQIDVVAYGSSAVLSVDCKHYRREQGPSLLERFAAAQLRRSELLRAKAPGIKPIVSVILSVSEPEGKFVGGVAVVPVRTLQSFLTSIDSYIDLLELR